MTAGEVELTLLPYITSKDGLDALVTISEGVPGEFDLEYWCGARRGAPPDNENLQRPGPIPLVAGYPTPRVSPQPQFTRTTLLVAVMQAASTGDYPVIVNTEITEQDPATGQITDPDLQARRERTLAQTIALLRLATWPGPGGATRWR
jgi:hypothetical protein